ncbi:EcsC family protein [Methylocapsa polymorpha]|uniref:EcsC family protein n=1 Tax=Methylocapsa polymorpha TaxID=3080828 RepID=A0ABZ0HN74_9HYPH|nr:EcsC family protein [Methylocapsa sp. RX1]
MNIAPSAASGWLVPSRVSALSADDLTALERAAQELERTSLAMRLTSLLGRQVGVIGSIIPPHVSEIANKAAEAAIKSALALALRSLDGRPARDSRRLHKSAAVLAGAAGGAFGFSALAVELPFTTTVMLRSIAAIAKSEGEDLSHPQAALACLEVFALGGRPYAGPLARGAADAGLETGYFAVRAILAKSVSEAAHYLVERGLAEEAAPVLVRFVTQIGARFGIVVSQKLAAQSIPVVGGVCGAAINYAFVDHFQTLARGHFTILRLERRYGAGLVRSEYEQFLKRA